MSDGFVICLACQDDGSIQVFVQDATAQADGDSAGAGASAGGSASGAGPSTGAASDDGSADDGSGGDEQTVDNIDDALNLVQQLYGEQMQQEQGGSGGSGGAGEDSDDGDVPMAPADAKSLWNRLAAKKDAQRNAN